MDRKTGEFKDPTLLQSFAEKAPGRCEAKVEWDGTPSFYVDPEPIATGTLDDLVDGYVSDMGEGLSLMFAKPSQGQGRIFRLKRLLDFVKQPPDLMQLPKNIDHVNDVWSGHWHKLHDYIEKLPRDGKPCLLLDEPDRSLSIPNQAQFWKLLVPKLVEHAQVIMATHSPFSFADGLDANVIDMEPGYVEISKQAMSEFSWSK